VNFQEPRRAGAPSDRPIKPVSAPSENGVNPTLEPPEIPEPALGGKGQPVVQINVEEDQPIGGGTEPVDRLATDSYHQYGRRTAALIATAIIVAALLAFPVIWAFVELFALAGVVGPWIWAWVALLIALVAISVIIGFQVARRGL